MIHEEFIPKHPCRPNPIVTFAALWIEERKWIPVFSNHHSLLLLRRTSPKKVSFARAFAGWRMSGAHEEKELGAGRAFLSWLQKYQLAIDWKEKDFSPHPYFTQKNTPRHDPKDELAWGLSFAIKPIQVKGRSVKLYVQDKDMMSLLSMPYGDEEDFLELVMGYVAQRFEWETWRAPAPTFLDWIISHGKRPVFLPGQLGLQLLK